MFRSVLPRLIAGLLLVAVAACHSNNTTTTPPTTNTTETFAGTLNPNGAATYQFTATTAGTITATLTSVTPDSTVTLGMSIGTWSGTSCSVGVGLALDNAVQGSVLTASVSLGGPLCLRVYDPGTLSAAANYSIDVSHP